MTESVPSDEAYFNWLIEIVRPRDARDVVDLYGLLCIQLYQTPFVWGVGNDDNRARDGILLREDFLYETHVDVALDWMDMDCSVLEMFVALTKRMEFETGQSRVRWFWEIVDNLGLNNFDNTKYGRNKRYNTQVADILHKWMYRSFDADGHGSIFPLGNPSQDQRGVEIWYQMSEYLSERLG